MKIKLKLLGALAALAVAAAASGQDRPRVPELEPNLGWLNTDRPLRFAEDLKGHVVLLDFWTYCCINCIHVLPDLEYLEEKYADEPFIVIGVHSAKFDNEATRESIRNAIFRYDIHHPVVIDDQFQIWRKLGARGWPTFVLIGADGGAIGAVSGEGNRDLLDEHIGEAIAKARAEGTLAAARVEFEQDASVDPPTGLKFPGKVLADPGGARLFVADSSHDRVLELSWPDDRGVATLQRTYGDGTRGFKDGSASEARLHDPQGMALDVEGDVLYVADTNNHAIRAIDLGAGRVSTIAGTGEQGRDRVGGGKGTKQALNSPWDLELSHDARTLYIAMAGPHQLWQMNLRSNVVERLAGSGRENIIDGPALEAALAQPSGLALSTDGVRLYFADSEGSAIRALDLDTMSVRTIIGRVAQDSMDNALFDFGDVDGAFPDARLQHCLGVALLPTDSGDRLLVADTYNHKLKLVSPMTQRAEAWAGAGRGMAAAPDELRLDEPGGVEVALGPDGQPGAIIVADTNNHRIVMVDPQTRAWREVLIEGVGADRPSLDDVRRLDLDVRPGETLSLEIHPPLPEGAHLTPEAPVTVRITRVPVPGQRMAPSVIAQRTLRTDTSPIPIDVSGEAISPGVNLLVEVSFAYCFDDLTVCAPGDASWLVTLRQGEQTTAQIGR